MKSRFWIVAVSLIIIAVIVGIYFLPPYSSSPTSTPTPTPSSPLPTPIPGIQLQVQNLTVWTSGTVSFKVILYEYESGLLEAVSVNDTRYSWADGSSEDAVIFRGETKTWRLDVGSFNKGDVVHVVVEASPEWGSGSATVETSLPDGNNQNGPNYVYDYYGGVGLFKQGIHIFATRQDPRTLSEEFQVANDYWKMLLETETTAATDQDFISILLSRGDQPTGGYNIQIESFSWLESYPVKFLFHVNFTDPGEGVMVTEALTNPLVLVPIGKLTPGEYHVEVSIVQYILNIDEEGNFRYTPIMTFAPVVWKQTLTIRDAEDLTSSLTFKVIVNENDAPDLTVQVDLTTPLTKEEARKIAEATFIRTMGEKVLRRLDTLICQNHQIIAHYTWGYDENDMGHIFDLIADLATLQITVTHCR